MKNQYRKKPVVIEAFQMTPARRTDNSEWPIWLHKAWNEGREQIGALQPMVFGTRDGLLEIVTLEGKLLVAWGDFIIRGVKGEIYPCKEDIFLLTYEKVE